MTALLLVLIAGTAAAILLLVVYGHFLFEENRTRVSRDASARDARSRTEQHEAAAADGVQWRTLVDPVDAANRARASQPFAAAYARALSAAHEDVRAA